MSNLVVANKNEMIIRNDKIRKKYIDIARGIAIILMVVGHVTEHGWKRDIIFSFHMPLFIIISGMFYKDRSFKELFTNMLKKLIIPYIITVFCTDFIQNFIIHKNYDFIKFLTDFIKQIALSYSYLKFNTNVKPTGVLWFIPFLIVLRIIFSALKKVTKNDDKLLAMYCLLISYIGYILGIKGKWLPFSADISMSCIILYCLGYLITKYDLLRKIINEKKVLFLIFIIWILGIKFGSIEIAVRRYPNGLYSFLSAICGSIIIIKLSLIIEQKTQILSKVLSWYGKNSIYILLFHHIEFATIDYKIILKYINVKMIYKAIVSALKIGFTTIGTILLNIVKKYILRKKQETKVI